MRFVWQWIVSERRQEMVVPLGFWYLSIVGGLMLTIYTVCRTGDPVLITGQAAGLVIYTRNLMLIRRSERKRAEAAAQAADSVPFVARDAHGTDSVARPARDAA
jgi:lipid-A-disaccharide synthase-like uncharacterized protein